MVGKETRVLGLGLGVLGFWKREDGEAGRRREEDAIVEEERERDRAEMKVNRDQPTGERERRGTRGREGRGRREESGRSARQDERQIQRRCLPASSPALDCLPASFPAPLLTRRPPIRSCTPWRPVPKSQFGPCLVVHCSAIDLRRLCKFCIYVNHLELNPCPRPDKYGTLGTMDDNELVIHWRMIGNKVCQC
ncbi:hypothetical protein Cgig2_030314 [Carnegiea gigantea]|uniref:Uncharacterized protein n=1 Tax=Carnegiea gigantea TaxID=171969 RepID=A0A9Q1Q861_9CARY|nr:hypothetical protein Cgig2_030314 [Carnegiea gigantea]